MTRVKIVKLWLQALLIAGLAAATATQAGPAPRVVADIAPVHSLVAQVMDEVNEGLRSVFGTANEMTFPVSAAVTLKGA